MHNRILIFFFGILIISSCLFKVFESSEEVNSEKRIKATLPTFKLASIVEFPENLTDYINDNFGGRSTFIALNSKVQAALFRSSGNDVAFGLNGWLYYSGPIMYKIYNNPIPLTEEELKHIATVQMERKEWLKLQGMDYYFFMPPISHSIYPENLPGSLQKSYPLTRREQILQYLQEHTDINVIIVDDILKKRKKDHLLYYKGDSHWNHYAGLYVYQYLADYFKARYPSIPSKLNEDGFNVIHEKDQSGDLYDLINLPKPENVIDTIFKAKKICYDVIIDPNKGPKKKEHYIIRAPNTCDSTLPSILFYRDSYSNFVWQHLANHFGKTVLLWEPNFQADFTKKENCDIVLFELVEHLQSHLEDENPTELKEELKRNNIKINIK